MLDFIDITSILFFDIETVPAHPDFEDLDETWQGLWAHKAKSILKKTEAELMIEDVAEVYEKAGIYAEFGKIVCISVGLLARDKATGENVVRLKSFASEDEAEILRGFSELLNKHYPNVNTQYMCGHNIKEFDVPYICRRLMIHQMPLPNMLNIMGKKPWETKHLLDTMDMWKFGDNKNFTSVKLLAAVFGFPSPKDDIDGSEVRNVFYEEKDVQRIARYCEKDVIAVINIISCLKRLPFRVNLDGKVISA
jgi:3'-5' exonuclease